MIIVKNIRKKNPDEETMGKKTFTHSSTNFSAAELMQYRSPVDGGPSLNRWPRCASHTLHTTSVLIMPSHGFDVVELHRVGGFWFIVGW